MYDIKWIKSLGNVTRNQKANLSVETRQENSLQVGPLINVLLGHNVATGYRNLWPGVRVGRNPLVFIQIGYKKVVNQKAVGDAIFLLKSRQGYLDLLTINSELLHERFSAQTGVATIIQEGVGNDVLITTFPLTLTGIKAMPVLQPSPEVSRLSLLPILPSDFKLEY